MLKRQFSTLLKKDLSNITLKELTLVNQNDEAGRVSLIGKLNLTKSNQELINYLIPDFSLYYKLKDENFNNVLLSRFIDLNPGRVYSTLELLNKHVKQVDDIILNQVFMKLQSEKSIDELVQFKKQFPHHNTNVTKLIHDLIGVEDFQSIFQLAECFTVDLTELKSQLTTTSGKVAFMEFFNLPQQPWALTVMLNLNFDQEVRNVYTSMNRAMPNRNCEIQDFINDQQLDLQDLPLRISLLKVLGMFDNNTEQVLKKFHLYQSKCPTGIDNIKIIMVNIFAYQFISTNKKINLQIAQSLVPPDTMTIKLLQILIIMNSNFNIDDAMNIYNQYINQVSSKATDGISQKGKLTESIIIGNLLNNDRNFAHLIFEKAIENQIINSEDTIQIKKVFRQFSDSFIENEDWESAKPKFKQYVLDYLQLINGIDYQHL